MASMLFIVEDTFWIQGRGLILVPGVSSHDSGVRIGDELLLRRPDGSTIPSMIRGVEMCGVPRESIAILVTNLNKDDVPIGTEVWSVEKPQDQTDSSEQ